MVIWKMRCWSEINYWSVSKIKKMSRRLQLQANLTLKTTVEQCHQSAQIIWQQEELQDVLTKPWQQSLKVDSNVIPIPQGSNMSMSIKTAYEDINAINRWSLRSRRDSNCGRCSSFHVHNSDWPAMKPGHTCHRCKLPGHFKPMCQTSLKQIKMK